MFRAIPCKITQRIPEEVLFLLSDVTSKLRATESTSQLSVLRVLPLLITESVLCHLIIFAYVIVWQIRGYSIPCEFDKISIPKGFSTTEIRTHDPLNSGL